MLEIRCRAANGRSVACELSAVWNAARKELPRAAMYRRAAELAVTASYQLKHDGAYRME
ncbi:hypothetical protein BGC_23200 [Burkholderia sp. 3C]